MRRNPFLRFGLIAVFAAALAFTLRIAPSEEGELPAEVIHRPFKTPDRVVLTWAADPATSMAVTWRTATSVTKAVAQIAVATDGPEFAKSTRDVPARTEPLRTDLSEAHFHSVNFTGLEPDTLYAYRVGDGWNWSEWNQFRTAKQGPAPLTFLYGGDAQNDLWAHWSRVVRAAYSHAPDARFFIHAGDLVNVPLRDQEWGDWFRAAGWITRTMPGLMTPGNHEYPRLEPSQERGLAPGWRPHFTLPANGPAGLEETCYYLDIHGVRIVSLNSNERQPEQAEWLDRLLANDPQSWTVLTFHHPIFSAAVKRDNPALRDAWKPVFDKHKVDLVLTGHDHTYARSNVVAGVNVRADSGTVYVVSVMGPKMYRVDREPWMTRAAEDTQLFQVIRIDGNRLTYESRTPRGVLYDAFELRKRKGRPNQLIDRIPQTPERFREETPTDGR